MNEIERLLTFTKEAVSPFHTVEAAGKLLEEKGFSPLSWKEEWNLNPGGKYYLVHHGSALFAFTIGKDAKKEQEIRMAAAHGDFPGFRIKPDPDMKAEAYIRLNTEPYGAEEKGFFKKYLAKKLDVAEEDILEYEMNIYNADPGELIGFEEEFVSGPRLDDLTGVLAILEGLWDGERTGGINLGIVFDHEEIGSSTKQGAGSTLLLLLLERIVTALGWDRMDLLRMLEDTMLLSVDVAHGVHPNYQEKADPTNHPVLNGGFCIKEASSQSYATDSEAIAIVQALCEEEKIPYQKFVNRSDGTGGGTLGAIASALVPVRTIDIGVPLLAMHSSRELMGKKDMKALTSFIRTFFSVE